MNEIDKAIHGFISAALSLIQCAHDLSDTQARDLAELNKDLLYILVDRVNAVSGERGDMPVAGSATSQTRQGAS